MSSLAVSVDSVELVERVLPLLKPGGPLAHLVPEDNRPPSQKGDVLALLAKRFLETELEWEDGVPPVPPTESTDEEEEEAKPSGDAKRPGTPDSEEASVEDGEDGEDSFSKQSTLSKNTLSKKTIKRRQQRKRAKEKQVADSPIKEPVQSEGHAVVPRPPPPPPRVHNAAHYPEAMVAPPHMVAGWQPVGMMLPAHGWAAPPGYVPGYEYVQVAYEMPYEMQYDVAHGYLPPLPGQCLISH